MAPPRFGASHPALVLAWRDANDHRTAWRLRYNLPANDPRVLDATDDEIVHDLLVQRYYAHLARREDPEEAGEAAASDEDVRRAMLGVKSTQAEQDTIRRVLERESGNRPPITRIELKR